MITYNTNQMGPWSMDWYRERGLLTKGTTVIQRDYPFMKHKVWDVVEVETITQYYAGGRIDIRGTGDPYGDEMSLPVMKAEDFKRFSEWLDTVQTKEVLSLKELVKMYEETNPKIQWWDYELTD